MTGQKEPQSFKPAFVLGGAECVWDDLESARAISSPDIVCCINDIGVDYIGDIDYWVSYHADKLVIWVNKRKKLGLTPARELWTGNVRTRFLPANIKKFKNTGGSSGLLATRLLLDESDATHIILCGVPLNPDMPHYHNAKNRQPWKDGRTYQKHWIEQKASLSKRVKSMSGWTAELLGTPTRKWLES